ncbi:aspartyl protease [candidate division WWE3 bacterium]|nr:aspartyl protease [candidate division WWE3 bacterium]
MGIAKLGLSVSNPQNTSEFRHLEFLIDSGAVYSAVPRGVLKSLGISPQRKEKFSLMDGSVIEREFGEVRFQYKDRFGTAPVIFGKEGDLTLLGVTALEVMGYGLNSLDGKLIKLRLTL